jgi:hypothetical protein
MISFEGLMQISSLAGSRKERRQERNFVALDPQVFSG